MTAANSNVGHKPTVHDNIALWLVRLAKIRRTKLVGASEEDYGRFYESFFADKDVEMAGRDPRMEVRRNTINYYLLDRVSPNSWVLDVGCGLGEVLSGLPAIYRLAGIDYAFRNAVITQTRLGTRADIAQASIYQIPFAPNSMDVCLCLEVLEHIEEDGQGLDEIARVLKPEGLLIAAVPYTYYWPDYKHLMGHFRHYSRVSLTQLLEAHGFTVVDYLPNYPEWHQSYTRWYALVRALALTVGRLFGSTSVYEFRWPWQRQPLLDERASYLASLYERDAMRSYSHESTSTFVAARRRG